MRREKQSFMGGAAKNDASMTGSLDLAVIRASMVDGCFV